MSEMARIAEQLRLGFEGDAWHGPALGEIVGIVSAEEAAARPIGRAHTIWEIVVHLAGWHDVVRRRLAGERVGSVPPDRDWPSVNASGAAAWDDARRELGAGHRRLREAVANLTDDRLGQLVPDTGDTVYAVLHGVAQHDAYHAGQIALLKKAAA